MKMKITTTATFLEKGLYQLPKNNDDIYVFA